MSDTRTEALGSDIGVAEPTASVTRSGTSKAIRIAVLVVAAVVVLLVPVFVEEFWLRTAFAVFAAIIGAIGLNLLVGTTGQLSLAHAFFLAVGAVTYTFISGEPGGTAAKVGGLQLPPLFGMVLGVLFAGIAGLLFSPVAARLRGIYLGVASLGLVFIGQHLMNTWEHVTGGFNGRAVPQFSLFGFSFGSDNPELFVLGVPFNSSERLWYLGVVLAIAAYVFAKNILRSRPGRALVALRDSEVAASVMGVNVQGYKARIFALSSMYAGLAGVLYALSIGSIAPESFALDVSVLYLAMIVLGGLGSVGGAALGAAFVASLPLLFQQYASALPLIAEPGQGGVTSGQAARMLFGLAIILVVLFEPAGLVGFADRFRRRGRRRIAAPPDPAADPTPSDPPAQGSTT